MTGGAGRTARIGLAAIACCIATGLIVAAEDVTGYFEFAFSDLETLRVDSDGPSEDTDSSTFFQRYNLAFDRWLSPTLRLRAGGFFEDRDTDFTSAGQSNDNQRSQYRPYFSLTFRTPLHTAELAWDRNEDRRKTDSLGATDVRQVYSARLGLSPDALPQVRLEYFGTEAYDKARLTRDSSENRIQLSSDYSPTEPWRLTYRGTFTDTRDRLNNNDIQSWSHTGRATYLNSFWDRRLRVNSDYRLTYRSSEITASGTGDVRFPLFLLAGLSTESTIDLLSMITLTLDPSPALVDGNTAFSAGINLVLPTVGANEPRRFVGLDFAGDSELNALLISVDASEAPTLVWEVYVSDDNIDWDRQTVTSVSFEPLLRRFEIRFPDVTARYAMAVVEPVAAVPTGPSSLAVTELQAELIRPADEVARKDSTTSHLLSLSARARLADAPALYYEFSHFLTSTNSSRTNYTVSNGLSLSHRFGPVYSLSSRLAREDTRRSSEDGNALLFGATLTASAIETLRQRLTFSARNEDGVRDARDSLSVFLFNTARLYRGIDVNLGIGKSTTETSSGRTSEGDEISATATIVPHRSMTFNLIYRDRSDVSRGGRTIGSRENEVRSGEASVAYNPLSTLYLYGSFRAERRTDVPRRTFENFSINWSPFRDGTLQFSVRYDETLRSEDDAKETTFTPRIRWNFSRGSFLDVSYQSFEIESNLQRFENDVLTGNLRFAF